MALTFFPPAPSCAFERAMSNALLLSSSCAYHISDFILNGRQGRERETERECGRERESGRESVRGSCILRHDLTHKSVNKESTCAGLQRCQVCVSFNTPRQLGLSLPKLTATLTVAGTKSCLRPHSGPSSCTHQSFAACPCG